MSEYTPTTDEVREAFQQGAGILPPFYDKGYEYELQKRGDAFDRWLAERDRQVAERAWYEGWDASERFGCPIDGVDSETYKNPYTKENNA